MFISLIILAYIITVKLEPDSRRDLEYILINDRILIWYAIINPLILLLNLVYVVYCFLDKEVDRWPFIYQQAVLYILAAPLVIRLIIWPIEFYVYNWQIFEYFDKLLPS